jgi:hypothetical protein
MKTVITIVLEHESPFPEGSEIDISSIMTLAISSGLIPIDVDHYLAVAQTDNGPIRNLHPNPKLELE